MTSYSQHQESAGLFSHFPIELLDQIVSSLSNRSIKNLRQTCTFLSKVAQLRFDRLFLSTNPRDIEVFTTIAQDDALRLGVRQIIYDDARFWDKYTTGPEGHAFQSDIGVPHWYQYLYEEQLKKARDILEKDKGILDHIKISDDCPESYKHYQELLQGQTEVISQGRDIDALRYGLTRFPNLTRVELTIATHGRQLDPFYHTPTIRSLPQNLIYPRARGWPGTDPHRNPFWTEPWDADETHNWRGFSVLTREVARHLRENPTSSINEFSIDVNYLPAGINIHLFENTDSTEYTDLVTILSYPGLRRFDLPLDYSGIEDPDDSAPLYDNVHKLLSMATDLEHVSLSTNIDFQDNDFWGMIGRDEHCFPLRSILPIDKWPNLRHLSLSRLFVKQDDVRDFLAAMPPTLKSIELSFLEFTPWYRDCYRGLFEDMRSILGWQDRPRDSQPKIKVLVERRGRKVVDVSAEAESYMYDGEENPFTIGSDPFYTEKRFYVFYDVGIEVDVFDPRYRHLDFPNYREARGYYLRHLL